MLSKSHVLRALADKQGAFGAYEQRASDEALRYRALLRRYEQMSPTAVYQVLGSVACPGALRYADRLIAAEYKRAVCMVSGDGREWWHPYSTRLVYEFMVAVADVLEQGQLAEGPLALAASRRQVEELERQLDAQRRGELGF